MDNFNIVLQHYQRLFPACAKVHSIGHIIKKRGYVDHTFGTFNVSLILEGEGVFGYDGQSPVPVRAPCVVTQWPGAQMHYGAGEDGWWRELYLMYDAAELPALEAMGFCDPARRWWKVENAGRFLSAAQQLLEIAAHADEPGMADRLDRTAEEAILESLLPGPRLLSKADLAVLRIKAVLERECGREVDFDRLAAEEGLSSSVFRRLWKKHAGIPPHRYQIEQRMSLARRLLSETALNISEIAYRTGHSDPLYFSRLFHKTTGLSATAYRRNYRTGTHSDAPPDSR